MRPRFEAVDGLRGMAILLVTLFHLQGWLPPSKLLAACLDLHSCGAWGVSLFFALSGFCLYHPLAAARVAGRPWGPWRTFFLRRAVRILPAYVVSLAVWLAIWSQTPHWPCEQAPFHQWPTELLRHLTFTHTFWRGSLLAINPVLWSLAVEVHYYLLFPVLAAAFGRWPWAFTGTAFLLTNALRLGAYAFVPGSLIVDGSLPAHLGEFAAGMLAAHLLAGRRAAKPLGWWVAPACTLGLLAVPALHRLVMAAVPNAGGNTDRAAIGLFSPLFVVLILAAAERDRGLLAWRPLALLGLISYSLYLYNLTPPVLSRAVTWWAPAGSLAWWVIMAGILIGVGTLGYVAIERPCLRLLARRLGRPTTAPPAEQAAVR